MQAFYEDDFPRIVAKYSLLTAIIEAVTIIALLLVLAHLTNRPAIEPYVLALDHQEILGVAHPFISADQAFVDEAIGWQLQQFIIACREVIPNTELENHNVHIVYAMARGQAYKALEDYYHGRKDRDPMQLAYQGYSRTVNITRTFQRPDAPSNWVIEWSETTHAPTPTAEPVTTYWEADMTIVTASQLQDAGLLKADTENSRPVPVMVTTLVFTPGNNPAES